MVAKLISLLLEKRINCGFALSGVLLSVGIFGYAAAENPITKVSKPVRILLTDDTPDATLSVRRKSADQRNLDKLYNNDLRPTKVDSNKVVEPSEKSEPNAEKNSGNDSPVNNHKSKLKQSNNNRDSGDSASTDLPIISSIDKLLPKIELPQIDVFGDIESAISDIGKELSSATISTDSKNTPKYASKMKHPGSFTPRHANKASGAPVHLPTFGSLDGIQFPKIKLADLNTIFGKSAAPLVDESEENPTSVDEKQEELTTEPVKDAVENKQSEVPAEERRGIIALLGLDELAIPELNNPFVVGTGIKENEQNTEPDETKIINPNLEKSDLEPDETITSELPSLNTERPVVPGINQIPTLAPKKIPDAPNPTDDEDKSASRMSPYKTLVNPDSFLPQRSAFPVSVRISDTPSR